MLCKSFGIHQMFKYVSTLLNETDKFYMQNSNKSVDHKYISEMHYIIDLAAYSPVAYRFNIKIQNKCDQNIFKKTSANAI